MRGEALGPEARPGGLPILFEPPPITPKYHIHPAPLPTAFEGSEGPLGAMSYKSVSGRGEPYS